MPNDNIPPGYYFSGFNYDDREINYDNWSISDHLDAIAHYNNDAFGDGPVNYDKYPARIPHIAIRYHLQYIRSKLHSTAPPIDRSI